MFRFVGGRDVGGHSPEFQSFLQASTGPFTRRSHLQRGFDIGEVWPGIWYEENRQAWTVRNSIMPVPVRTGVAHDHRLRGRTVVLGRGFERARSVPRSRIPTTVRRKQTSRAADDRAPPLERIADALGLRISYAGDWNLSPEWYGTQSGGWGRTSGETVFTRSSPLSGEVTVTAHEASPLGNERNAEWRVLRFNEKTRQSVVRIADGKADPGCLATEYLKTVVAVIAAVWGARGDTAGTVSPSRALHRDWGWIHCHVSRNIFSRDGRRRRGDRPSGRGGRGRDGVRSSEAVRPGCERVHWIIGI